MNQAEVINPSEDAKTRILAADGLMLPEGISREAVLGFLASNWRSMSRLKAMAAVLANTMHNNTNPNLLQLK